MLPPERTLIELAGGEFTYGGDPRVEPERFEDACTGSGGSAEPVGWVGASEVTHHGACGLVGTNRPKARVHADGIAEEAPSR